jgi:hypothetical protein
MILKGGVNFSQYWRTLHEIKQHARAREKNPNSGLDLGQ